MAAPRFVQRAMRWRPKLWQRVAKRRVSPLRAALSAEALGAMNDTQAKATWQKHLRDVGYRAALIPIGDKLDHRKPLLVLVPGMGENLRDMRELIKARSGGYQVVIALTDHLQSWSRNGKDLARALERLMHERNRLARKHADPLPPRHVQMVGHSAGAMTLDRALVALSDRGILRTDGSGLFSRVDQLLVDAPTRGLDAPWLLKHSRIKHLLAAVLPRLPWLKRRGAQPGVFSLVSGDSLMRSLTRSYKLPPTVRTRFVAVVDDTGHGRTFGVPHPLRSMYSHDLGRGELVRLRNLLVHRRGKNPLLDHDELGKLAYFRLLGLTHVHGLSNSLRMLRHAAGYKDFANSVRRAANLLPPEKFAAAYDAALSRFLPTFYGEHTKFMWTHRPGQTLGGPVRDKHLVQKRFIDWLGGELAKNSAEHQASK